MNKNVFCAINCCLTLRISSCNVTALAPPFKLTNEAAERDEEEDMSTVKWLSGYVNAGRRQEHNEDSALRELEKKICVTVQNQSPSTQRHDLPICTQCQRYSTTHICTALSNKHNSVSTDEKKKYIHVYFTRRAHFSVQTVN